MKWLEVVSYYYLYNHLILVHLLLIYLFRAWGRVLGDHRYKPKRLTWKKLMYVPLSLSFSPLSGHLSWCLSFTNFEINRLSHRAQPKYLSHTSILFNLLIFIPVQFRKKIQLEPISNYFCKDMMTWPPLVIVTDWHSPGSKYIDVKSLTYIVSVSHVAHHLREFWFSVHRKNVLVKVVTWESLYQ